MKSKILVATLITVLLIAIVSTPMNVLATTKSGYDDPKKGNDDDKNKNVKHDDDDDHKTHNSCINLPRETPFRDLWIFVCSFQTQIDQINAKLDALSTGGGTGGGTTTSWCPTATNIVLTGADLRLRSLVGCNLSNADFSDADLTYANFIGADLTDAKFSHATLNYADLSNAKLQNTDFTGAFMTGTITTGCHYGTTPPHGTPSVGTLPVCVP